MGKLENKIAIITGGTSGIGKSIVEEFLDEGANVICVGRNKNKIHDLLECSKFHNKLDFVGVDVSNETEINRLKCYVEKKYNQLDILVNCAGIWHTHKLEDITFDEFELMFNTNTASVIFMTKLFMPF